LDVIEKAIRNAFDKGNADDRAFRERVYRSAFAALDKAIKANPAMTVEAAIRRRKALQASIAEIESEFLPAIAVPSVEPDAEPAQPAVAPPVAPARQADVAPPVAAPSMAAQRAPSVDAGDPVLSGPLPSVAPDGDYPAALAARRPGPTAGAIAVDPDGNPVRARRRRRPYAALFLLVTLLAAAGIGAWWASQTGLFLSHAERDTSVPNPPQTSEPEDFVPEEEAPAEAAGTADPDRSWIDIFTPTDLEGVTTPGSSKAEVMQDDSGSFLRISSGASGATVLFDVGQGVLEQLAGKSATFDIVARGGGGEQTEMSIDCNFGNFGDCGRKRYAVGFEQADFLFEVQFPDENPGSAGAIAINSDFSGAGKSVDIYAIRVAAPR